MPVRLPSIERARLKPREYFLIYFKSVFGQLVLDVFRDCVSSYLRIQNEIPVTVYRFDVKSIAYARQAVSGCCVLLVTSPS